MAAPTTSDRADVPDRDRPPRILIASGSAELYGSDRVMVEAVRGFVEGGADVTVVAGAAGPLLPTLEYVGARTRVQAVPVLRRAYTSPSGLVRFAGVVGRRLPGMVRTLLEVRPDVLYVNTVTLPVWTLAGRLAGVPVVVHVHEAEAGRAAFVRRILTAPLAVADRLVFNSETSRALAEADTVAPLPARSVVLNPVPAPSGVEPARERLDGPVRLLYMGRISERKGVDVALEATATLVAAGHDVTLDLVGDIFPGYEWFLQAMTERASRLDLAGRVRFHGFHADIGPFLSRADVVLIPSRADESFGNVLIEAVSAGRPVVAAAQNGLREASSGLDCVRFVPAGDAAATADAVLAITADWPAVCRTAREDAAVACRRHDPAAFRRALRHVLNEELPTAP